MPVRMSKWSKSFLVFAIVLSLALGVYFKSKPKVTNPNLSEAERQNLVLGVVEKCANTEFTNACFKTSAKDLVDQVPVASIFEIIEQKEKDLPKLFQFCHELLHFVGQENYGKIGNVGQALFEGNPLCFAGYYHGVLEAYMKEKSIFEPEQIAQVVPSLCADLKGQKDHNECLHGLGHALMYATNYELPKSLELCDALEKESDESWCYSGVFMENSTSSTNKDHPSQYLKKGDILYPCNILEEKYLNMCYTLQGFYFAEISEYDWKKTGEVCLKVPKNYIGACFNSIGQSQVGFTTDEKIMKSNCELFPAQAQSCYKGLAGALKQRYNSTEKLDALCLLLKESERDAVCQLN